MSEKIKQSHRAFSRLFISDNENTDGPKLEDKYSIQEVGGRLLIKRRKNNIEITGGNLSQREMYRNRQRTKEELLSDIARARVEDNLNNSELRTVINKMNALDKKLSGFISNLEQDIFHLSENHESFKRESYQTTFLLQQGAKLSDLGKTIPIKVYLSDEKGSNEVEKAIQQYISENDGHVVEDYKPIYGSWFKEWIAKIFTNKTKRQLEEDLIKARKAVELKTISKPQSEVDLNNCNGLAQLTKAFEHQENAVAQVGSLLFLKYQANGVPLIICLLYTSDAADE